VNAAIILAYLACIPLANWLILHVGPIPVFPGILAPSGVLVVGLALVLRDAIQTRMGLGIALAATLCGVALSTAIASHQLALASGLAFLLSEVWDAAIFTSLIAGVPRTRATMGRLALAIVVSGIAGAALDSLVFLYLAFGDMTFFWGQFIGKLYASLLFGGLLIYRRPYASAC
jgi:uncharacterized PurR-regulated membrane protein YhhQ (DUF165 family)